MNSLKRIFITLKTQLDSVVDDFENHEALAGVAIKELEEWRVKTRVHQHRLQKMIEQFEAKLNELQKESALWSARAVKVRETDEQRALQCVKRLLHTRQQIQSTENQLREAQEQHQRLQADLSSIETQLRTLSTQKEVLAARQNRIELQSVFRSGRHNPAKEAESIFNRWEESITGAEFSHPDTESTGSFADAFIQEEEALELEMLLNELSAKTGTNQENPNVHE